MNIYQTKNRWKLFLGIGAFIIAIAMLVFSNYLVNKIAKEEEDRVRIWAEAIGNRAKLVHKTDSIFKIFEIEDKKNINLWAEANKYIATSEGNAELYWPTRILSNNTTIPIIITDEHDEILLFNNFPKDKSNDTSFLNQKLREFKAKKEPLDLSYKVYGITMRQYLYYDDSYIYSELKTTIDDLVQSFISETVINSASVPVIITNEEQDSVIASGNLQDIGISYDLGDEILIDKMKSQNKIEVELNKGNKNYIYYMNSNVIQLLKIFPFIFLGIIAAFLFIAYLFFSTSRRNEQNQVWVGMSKETAHQLGTPLTSLLGWLEYLKSQNVSEEAIAEIEKDINRLQIVAERFSKIGSTPELHSEDIHLVLQESIHYMQLRTSSKIVYNYNYYPEEYVSVKINKPLFEWVIENLFRNAIDAINGKGEINVDVTIQNQKWCIIDITDSGKGVPKNQFKMIFRPGFTTKKRGWGLGLSLTKRIIEEYHNGKIFVKWSEVNKGTTFRIMLKL